jgi:hypothetical protein
VNSPESDYLAVRDSLASAVRGARLLARAWTEAEAFVDMSDALARLDPDTAVALGAAAIVRLAVQPDAG